MLVAALLGRDVVAWSNEVTHRILEPFKPSDAATVSCEVIVVSLFVKEMASSVKSWHVTELNHLMTGTQLPLYVILHVTMMTSYSCTAPEADRFAEQLVSLSASETTFRSRRIFEFSTQFVLTIVIIILSLCIFNKKTVLSQGNRVMPQLFFSV